MDQICARGVIEFEGTLAKDGVYLWCQMWESGGLKVYVSAFFFSLAIAVSSLDLSHVTLLLSLPLK